MYSKTLEAKPHTPVYRMHKYFARRPWNVFSDLISRYSSSGDIVLDPFCGGGVTVVEALKLRRKAVGVDVNPIAAYVTSMECASADLAELRSLFTQLADRVGSELSSLYRTHCDKCRSDAVADWLEWDEKTERILRIKCECPTCGSFEKAATEDDYRVVARIERSFESVVKERNLWFPLTRIPRGVKTDYLLSRNILSFDQLFTKRNLLALSILRKEISKLESVSATDLLSFAFSSSLKWASRQSHLRGTIVEGWAMHAYWIYPKSLELNVWNIFKRRFNAVHRGKSYSNDHIGDFSRFAHDFNELVNGDATCLVLTRNSADLPVPDNAVDTVITDPPYGGNVNYAELSDFWYIWMNDGKLIEKKDEVIINKTQGKSLTDYQRLLKGIFDECHRVLKPGGSFVSTFNSKDFRVVASFITAAVRSGFALPSNGAQYQAPIRPYMTTFHAMQIGAFVGDFVFTFKKTTSEPRAQVEDVQLQSLKNALSLAVDESAKGGQPEPMIREQAYGLLIPFLAKYALSQETACREAADFFERKIRLYKGRLKITREKLMETRRRKFRKSTAA
ncbi:MAG: DNA methyltransferase [Candidatus Bathyarchaeia archaeon]